MIDLSVFTGLAGINIGTLADKPTTLTPGQKEAAIALKRPERNRDRSILYWAVAG